MSEEARLIRNRTISARQFMHIVIMHHKDSFYAYYS